MNGIVWPIFITFVALSGFMTWLNDKVGLENDGSHEELLEEVIEISTGVDVDLTPEDKEDEKYPR